MYSFAPQVNLQLKASLIGRGPAGSLKVKILET